MSKYIQTLRIGLALFLSVFGTSAIPAAAASALDDGGTVVEQQATEPVAPTETAPPPAEPAPPPEPPVVPVEEVAPAPPTPEPVELPEPQLPEVATPEPQVTETQEFAPQALRQSEPVIEPVIVATKPISAKALDDHECNVNEWHFVITQIDVEANVPPTITVNFANGNSVVVNTNNYTGKTAHYTTTSNLNSTVSSATTNIYSTWSGEFNLSHGPCNEEEDTIPVPAKPVPSPATCDTNGSLTLPEDTDDIKWTISPAYTGPGTYDVTATAQNGKTFEGTKGNTTVTFEDIVVQSKLSGEECTPPPVECPKNTEWSDLNDNQKVDEGECFKKVWVCKYVGIPGINERLKQGNDGLVQVSVHAIQQNQWDGTIPGWFSDAQDRSYVIDFVDDKKDPPSAEDCPRMEEPTVSVLDTVCIAEGETGSFTVRVTNTNDYAIEYRVDADGGKSVSKIVAANSYADFTFTGYAAGTYGYEVFQKTAVVEEENENLSFVRIALPQYQWQKIAEGEVTLKDCGRVLGETDVCPNLTGTQTTVPAGYVLSNGQCVVPQTPQVLAAVAPAPLPATIPATGASDSSNLYLVLGLVLSAFTYFGMLRRYQEA